MSGRSPTYRLRPDVRYRVIGGEAVVMRQQAGEVVVLNEVGSRMLQLLAQGLGLPEIMSRLLEEFSVERHELERDLAEFVHTLETGGVLERNVADAALEGAP